MEYSVEQLTVTGLINVSSPVASRCSFALIKYVANSRQDILWKTFSRYSSLLFLWKLRSKPEDYRLLDFHTSFPSSLLFPSFLFSSSSSTLIPSFEFAGSSGTKTTMPETRHVLSASAIRRIEAIGRSLGGKYGALTDRMLIDQHNAPHRRDFAISRMTYKYLTERFSSVNTSRSILRFTASTKTGQKPDEFERFLIRKTRVVVFLRQTSKESDNRIV